MEILPGKREKKYKKSRKTENNEAGGIGILEVENLGRQKVVEGKLGFEKDEIAEMEQKDGETVKKKKKAKKDAKGAEMEKKKSTNEDQVLGMCSEDRNLDAMEKVEKKRKTEKDKSVGTQSPETKRMKSGKEVENGTKNKKTGRDYKDGYTENKGRKKDRKEIGKCSEIIEVNAMEKVEGKKRKREKKQGKDDGSGQQDTLIEASANSKTDDDLTTDKLLDDTEGNVHLTLDQTRDNEVEDGNKGKKKKPKLVDNGLNSPKTKKSNKKVRFSSHVEVFPPTDDSNAVTGNDEGDNLVRGKRFTREEDEIVEAAVYKYIEEHDLGEEGLKMVLNSKKYPKVKNCWKEIGTAIPYRPYNAVYFRAQILFRRSDTRKWTQEEYEMVRQSQKEHGNQWRALADELGKHSWHVKDTWRRIKLPNIKKGHWSQEEYQGLFDLVNSDLQEKVFEEKRSKHGMLRDNICWTAISDKLSTRNQANCCHKWYGQLTSPMVAEGTWADVDDYRLLSVLFNLDSSCIEDVDWDNLLDDRSGDVCRMRWNQMVLHIGKHGNKSFAEQVEVLAQRYCPHLLEAREAWDSKPRVQ
ncbi:DNA-binding protein REB1-like [Forsythia ovata]|uniref:DNA-binding protein REB1-like n=1 Tax=Forsythia ovata TaxID=205694 RepID=A0ABD1TRI9_9LAMI